MRVRERIPSAPMSRSASAVPPSANRARTPLVVVSASTRRLPDSIRMPRPITCSRRAAYRSGRVMVIAWVPSGRVPPLAKSARTRPRALVITIRGVANPRASTAASSSTARSASMPLSPRPRKPPTRRRCPGGPRRPPARSRPCGALPRPPGPRSLHRSPTRCVPWSCSPPPDIPLARRREAAE